MAAKIAVGMERCPGIEAARTAVSAASAQRIHASCQRHRSETELSVGRKKARTLQSRPVQSSAPVNENRVAASFTVIFHVLDLVCLPARELEVMCNDARTLPQLSFKQRS